jgi:outer membrane putative beta-barrel porin/alpha-amylase
MTRITLAALAALTTLAGSAAAQTPTIATDRPDFVESSQTVGRGRFQFETSVSSDVTNHAGARETVWGAPTLLRLGVSERVELRFETDGFQRVTQSAQGISSTVSGMADAALGIKWHVREGIGVLVHADLPSGSPMFRGIGVRPSLRGVAEWELPGNMSLGLMPGVVYDADDTGRRFVTGLFGATLGKAWTSTFRMFVEYSAQELKPSAYGEDVITYDLGAAYLLRHNWQLDAAVSLGAAAAPDMSFTVGLSALLP